MAEEEKKAKQRRPQALKRDIQSEKRRLINRSFKSRALTTVRSLEAAMQSGDKAKTQEQLSAVYSIMDKGVKSGILKKNKANRVKARLSKKLLAK
ncbi:MAG: 30S ribosomal protein S20 [Chlamydiales bacterium]|nr:30S ribosomal protein S20 [Chlamydiales bacterium]